MATVCSHGCVDALFLMYILLRTQNYAIDKEPKHTDDFIFCEAAFAFVAYAYAAVTLQNIFKVKMCHVKKCVFQFQLSYKQRHKCIPNDTTQSWNIYFSITMIRQSFCIDAIKHIFLWPWYDTFYVWMPSYIFFYDHDTKHFMYGYHTTYLSIIMIRHNVCTDAILHIFLWSWYDTDFRLYLGTVSTVCYFSSSLYSIIDL